MSHAAGNEEAADASVDVPMIARSSNDHSQGVRSCVDGDNHVIAVLMDVTEPLEKLRKLLESQLQCSLEQFEFWLQDTMKVVGFFCRLFS